MQSVTGDAAHLIPIRHPAIIFPPSRFLSEAVDRGLVYPIELLVVVGLAFLLFSRYRRLTREWDEKLATGQVIFHWGEYVAAKRGSVVSIGVSPSLGAHDTLICHAARGEEWLWHGPLQFATEAGTTSLSASLFNEPVPMKKSKGV